MSPLSTKPAKESQHDLDIMDFTQIFQSLAASVRAGTLEVRDEQDRRSRIYFDQGSIRYLDPPQGASFLCKALLKSAMVTEDVMRRCLELREQTGAELDAILLKHGGVNAQDIQEALDFIVLEEVCDLFQGQRLRCRFVEGEATAPLYTPEMLRYGVSIPADALLMEAARRMDEWDVIRQSLPSLHDVYELTPKANRYYEAGEEFELEQEVLSLINGIRDVWEVTEYARMSSFAALKFLKHFRDEGDIRPVASERLLALADDCRERGFLAKALKLYERARELKAERDDLLLVIAQTLEGLGQTERAAHRYLEHALLRHGQEDWDGAADVLAHVVELTPEDTDSRVLLVDTLKSAGRAAETAPHLRVLARAHREAGRGNQALEAWRGMLEALPQDREAFEAVLAHHQAAEDRIPAIMEFEQLASELIARRAFDDALRVLESILQIDEGCLEAHLQIATTLAEIGRGVEAVKAYMRLANVLKASGVIEDTGNWGFLINVYEKIVALEPDNLEAQQWLAQAYDQKAESDKALAHYQGVVEKLRQRGATAELIEALGHIIQLSPDPAEALAEQADLQIDLMRSEDAQETLLKLAEHRASRRDAAGAQQAIARILELDPFNFTARRRGAELRLEFGEREAALDQYQRLFHMAQGAGMSDLAQRAAEGLLAVDARHIEALLCRARAQAGTGHALEAGRTLEKAIEVLIQRQDLGRAREVAEELRRLDPESFAAAARLRELDELGRKLSGEAPSADAPVLVQPMAPQPIGASSSAVGAAVRKASVAGSTHRRRRLKDGAGGPPAVAEPAEVAPAAASSGTASGTVQPVVDTVNRPAGERKQMNSALGRLKALRQGGGTAAAAPPVPEPQPQPAPFPLRAQRDPSAPTVAPLPAPRPSAAVPAPPGAPGKIAPVVDPNRPAGESKAVLSAKDRLKALKRTN